MADEVGDRLRDEPDHRIVGEVVDHAVEADGQVAIAGNVVGQLLLHHGSMAASRLGLAAARRAHNDSSSTCAAITSA